MQSAPTHRDLTHLRATRLVPAIHSIGNFAALLVGLWLSARDSIFTWIPGQLLLTMVFVHAFVLLHEAGHQTLFRSRLLNTFAGHYASFLSLIPFASWRPVHARHHKYTGWQDLDATTATLVPRKLSRWEQVVIDGAWRTGLPLFSTLYRLQNYWHIPRIHSFLNNIQSRRQIIINALLLLFVYTILIYWFGWMTILVTVIPALLLAFALEDVLLLSQHTHIPQNISAGNEVKTFQPKDQAQFSRSLRLPTSLSSLLMHFDAHELHHMYPEVPGYRLRTIKYQPPNEVHWMTWIKAAKGLRGTEFLFKNRHDTGHDV